MSGFPGILSGFFCFFLYRNKKTNGAFFYTDFSSEGKYDKSKHRIKANQQTIH